MLDQFKLLERAEIRNALEEIAFTQSEHDTESRREAAVSNRILEMRSSQDKVTAGIVPLVDPAAAPDVDYLLSGGSSARPTKKVLEALEQTNSAIEVENEFFERDIEILEKELARCSSRILELRERSVTLEAEAIKAITDAMISETREVLQSVVDRYLRPLNAFHRYDHFQARCLLAQMRVSWHTGSKNIQVWPLLGSDRSSDGSVIDQVTYRSSLLKTLLAQISETEKQKS